MAKARINCEDYHVAMFTLVINCYDRIVLPRSEGIITFHARDVRQVSLLAEQTTGQICHRNCQKL